MIALALIADAPLEPVEVPIESPAPTPESPSNDGVRWVRVLLTAAALSGVFYLYEHAPLMYAGGARDGLREDRLLKEFVEGAEEGNLRRKIALLSFGAMGFAAIFVCREQRWNIRWFGVLLLAALLAWAAASTTWSDEPGISQRRLAATFIALLGSLGVARLLRPNEVVAMSLVAFGSLITLSLVIDLAAGARYWNSVDRFSGTLHANTQSVYCGVFCLAAFCQAAPFGLRWLPRAMVAYGAALILLTKSRTGAVAVVAGLFVTAVTRLSFTTRFTMVAAVVSGCAVAVISIASLGDGERKQIRDAVLLGRTQQSKSLTGRIPLWQELWRYAERRLPAGYGYEGFWTPKRIDAVMRSQGWTLQSAHNAYLEVLLQLGLIGLALALGVVATSAWLLQSAFELTQQAGYAFTLGVFALGAADSLLQAHFHSVEFTSIVAAIGVMSVLFFFPDAAESDAPAPHGPPPAMA